MASTTGRGSHRSSCARVPSSARPGGTNGSTPPSRKQSGLATRRRSCCIWPSCSRPSGAPSHPSSAAPHTSASSTTRSCSTRLRGATLTSPTTPAASGQARSTRTPRPNRRALTRSTWTRTKRKCSQRRVLVWPTPAARKRSARLVRSSWRRPVGWRRCRNGASSRLRASTWPAGRASASGASTTAPRSPSSSPPQPASMRWGRRSGQRAT
mmetsp:Transcript_24518/g.60592  ORF Transcript_24518/g.60592 Transcript_24518/m.60592 type:complete len:211 (-) Transcript_24518:535-1167(-)